MAETIENPDGGGGGVQTRVLTMTNVVILRV